MCEHRCYSITASNCSYICAVAHIDRYAELRDKRHDAVYCERGIQAVASRADCVKACNYINHTAHSLQC
jgi:hypothetical protein